MTSTTPGSRSLCGIIQAYRGAPICHLGSRPPERTARFHNRADLQRRLLPHHDLGADRDPAIQVNDVGVREPVASGENGVPDRLRLVGAMDPIGGAEKHGARTQRIARTALEGSRQLRLARDHVWRRRPVGPFRFSADAQQALPFEAFAADRDAISDRPATVLYDIKMAVHRIDYDRPDRLVRAIEDGLPLECRRHLLVAFVRHDAGLLPDRQFAWLRLCALKAACDNTCQYDDQESQEQR